mmetsp:Transcript_2680/g.7531  ORF Transcript_2680/g.7531 Transcript_2680/m.7531 type:complete len:349 (-) Transcript_2680:195-1241(-)
MPNIEVVGTLSDAVNLAPRREVVYVSPLEVSFSQNVIYPKFTDGKSVDDAVKKIRILADGDADSEEDVLLEAPFPTIEAVYWVPKLRDGEGRPLVDENGEQRRGSEGLFTVDNRRLYALQRVAVAQFPRKCRVAVALVTDRLEVMRHLKKFRTRTNGLSITISEWNGVGRDNTRAHSALRVWDWRSAVASVHEGVGEGNATAAEAAESGSCGCWEYLDNDGARQGPFSHWQMRQWWERSMLPGNLPIRPYDAAAVAVEKGTREGASAAFLPVLEVFRDAPAPFAAGWTPRATDQDAEWRRCAHCNRRRWEGWTAEGQWYCAACWRRWEAKGRHGSGPTRRSPPSGEGA